MAGPTGFEPAISSVTGRRDRPLHYGPECFRKLYRVSPWESTGTILEEVDLGS